MRVRGESLAQNHLRGWRFAGRPPSAGCADQRSAFPGQRCHAAERDSRDGDAVRRVAVRVSLRFAQRCRSEGPTGRTAQRSVARASGGSAIRGFAALSGDGAGVNTGGSEPSPIDRLEGCP